MRQWREYRGLSLRRFAELMQTEDGELLMSHANIGRVETLQQPYSQDLLEAASVALRCSVTDLLTVDPMSDKPTPKISKPEEIQSFLEQVQGLTANNIEAFVTMISNTMTANAALRARNESDGRSELDIRRREELPSR